MARKNLRILAEGESLQGNSALRMANIEKTDAGTFRLNPRFVPPLLNISASDYALGILRGLIEILSARSSQLSGMRRQKNQSLADFTASDIADFWLLYTVNSHFPMFKHMFENGSGHPEEAYSAMSALAGSLIPFRKRFSCVIFPSTITTGSDRFSRNWMKNFAPCSKPLSRPTWFHSH